MWEVLTFEKFITQDVLIFMYYLGVLFIPFMLFVFQEYVLNRIKPLQKSEKKLQKFLLFLMLFFCMELCLRMFFEFMIGYFDMHDYLYAISQQ